MSEVGNSKMKFEKSGKVCMQIFPVFTGPVTYVFMHNNNYYNHSNLTTNPMHNCKRVHSYNSRTTIVIALPL